MNFENPIKSRVKELEKQLQNKKNETSTEIKKDINDDNILLLNDILSGNEHEVKSEIEYIDFPIHGTITNVPRSIDMTFEQLGRSNIKYENIFDNVNKII